MDRLPLEVLQLICQHCATDVSHLHELMRVNKIWRSLVEDQKTWYHLYKTLYPRWSSQVPYVVHGAPVDWRALVVDARKLHSRPIDIQKMAQDETIYEVYPDPTFPVVGDIDETGTGIIVSSKNSEGQDPYAGITTHYISLCSYPSNSKMHTMTIRLGDYADSCEPVALQSVKIQQQNGHSARVRLLALAVTRLQMYGHGEPDDLMADEDTLEEIGSGWVHVLIYRVFDDGHTQFIANVDPRPSFLGKKVSFYSAASLFHTSEPPSKLAAWLRANEPDAATFDAQHTVFMLLAGIEGEGSAECILVHVDLRPHANARDPAARVTSVTLISPPRSSSPSLSGPLWPEIWHSSTFPRHVQSMDHFGAPLCLAHLLCIVSCARKYILFDWLSGDEICELPWENPGNTHDCVYAIKLAFVVLPPPQNEHISAADLLCYGPRLVALDSPLEKHHDPFFQNQQRSNDIIIIKVWDLSSLLQSVSAEAESGSMLMEPVIAPPLLNERIWDRADVFSAKLAWQCSYWDNIPVSSALCHDSFAVLRSSLVLLGKSKKLGIMNIESGEIERVTNLRDYDSYEDNTPHSIASIDNSTIFLSCSLFDYQCSV
ncbi:hypothetical protein BC940DRAFT_352868 [Gongronella butleri]|nr:hypothetical protein BC940DRAFT_352868 [Gongronella butleri]